MNLVHSLPDYILNFDGDSLSADGLALLKDKKSAYKAYFCELGSGSGGHLIELARKDPKSLYVGFELRFKRAFRTAEKAAKLGLQNLLVVRGDVSNISRLFAPGSVQGLYVNFPDPWDRKKWRKHRMLNEESLKSMSRLLRTNGFIRYKTDHEGYFKDTMTIVSEIPCYKVETVVSDLHHSSVLGNNIESEFEKLFKYKQVPVFFADIRKS